jgi:RNA polymerase sigma-70 factor, ECF subfamily
MADTSPHYPADEAGLLESARAGDENAFAVLLERHRCGLELCCYLMLGDPDAARHAVADTAVSAWRERTLVEPRASARIWLYRVAVRICCEAAGDPISFGSEDRLTS